MITQMDHAIGEVINELKAVGVWENTLLVFSSDVSN